MRCETNSCVLVCAAPPLTEAEERPANGAAITTFIQAVTAASEMGCNSGRLRRENCFLFDRVQSNGV